MYLVKEEYRELWGNSTNEEDYMLTYEQIKSLANEWEKDIDELLEQCDVIDDI